MNLLERGIEALSPGWAAKRAYYRSMLTAARAYDAAKTRRRTDGWITSGSSANAEIATAAARVRERARDLVRNNPWAAAAVRKLPTKVVGTGIMPRLRARPDEVDRKDKARAEWEAFVEASDPERRLDFYGQQNLIARTWFEAGEALVRFLPRPASFGLRVPLQLQVLEPDFLDASQDRVLDGGGQIVQGVEYDAQGRRAAYWLFAQHPGDALRSFAKRTGNSLRVPASEVLHIFEPHRPGQARGVSLFAAVALRMRDVDDYDDAEIMRKKIAACFAGFVKRTVEVGKPLATSARLDDSGRRVESIAPGLVQYQQPGEDVTFPNPPAAEGYLDFMKLQLHAISVALGMTYEQMTGDLSQVNYSSIRAGMIDFWDLVDQWQWLVLIPQLCQPVWNRVAALLAATGKRDLQQEFQAVWTPPRRRWVDPLKEVAALKDAIRAGLTTLPAAIAEQGEDPDEVLAEIAATAEKLDALALVLDSDPRKVSNAGLTQARPQGTALPAAGAPGEDHQREE